MSEISLTQHSNAMTLLIVFQVEFLCAVFPGDCEDLRDNDKWKVIFCNPLASYAFVHNNV